MRRFVLTGSITVTRVVEMEEEDFELLHRTPITEAGIIADITEDYYNLTDVYFNIHPPTVVEIIDGGYLPDLVTVQNMIPTHHKWFENGTASFSIDDRQVQNNLFEDEKGE